MATINGKEGLVSSYEVARAVAKALEGSSPGSAQEQFMPGAVVKIIATFSKFVTHFF